MIAKMQNSLIVGAASVVPMVEEKFENHHLRKLFSNGDF